MEITRNSDLINKEDIDKEKLPDILKNLEIVPLMPTSKLRNDEKLPLLLNPFYFDMKMSKISNSDNDKIKLFGPKCSKCIRQKLSNVEHTIVNQTSFKHKSKDFSRRINIKESLFKTLKNSIYHNHSFKSNAEKSIQYSDRPVLDDGCLKLSSEVNQLTSKTKDCFDLHILIKNCDLISPYNNGTKLSKNFTTLQSSDNRIIKNKQKFEINSSDVSNSYNNISNINFLNSSSSFSPSCSTSSSCSQQARNSNSTSVCDITIDELACYFETFVHIPKKMSTMAEMMYI